MLSSPWSSHRLGTEASLMLNPPSKNSPYSLSSMMLVYIYRRLYTHCLYNACVHMPYNECTHTDASKKFQLCNRTPFFFLEYRSSTDSVGQLIIHYLSSPYLLLFNYRHYHFHQLHYGHLHHHHHDHHHHGVMMVVVEDYYSSPHPLISLSLTTVS